MAATEPLKKKTRQKGIRKKSKRDEKQKLKLFPKLGAGGILRVGK